MKYAYTSNYHRILHELSSVVEYMSDEEIEKAMFVLWAEQQSRSSKGEEE